MDSTLAKIIYPMLIQLKESKHGVPNELVSDVGGEDWTDQNCFDFYKETHDESWEIACKRWDEVLDKMIWSFEQIAYKDYDSQYHHGHAEYDWKKTDQLYPNPISGKMEATYQMLDKNPSEHWYDFVGHQKHEERIQDITFIPSYSEVQVDYEPGTEQMVRLHDGPMIKLRKLAREYDPTDRWQAMKLMEESRVANEFVTGLLYINEARATLPQMMNLSDTPLAYIDETQLRPSRDAFANVMSEF